MKIICPYHEDSNPSMELYPTGWGWCFVCSKGSWIDEAKDVLPVAKPKEDIRASLDKIIRLPTVEVRGIRLHADDLGYYIVWPHGNYYKYRYYDGVHDDSRYRNPIGHTQPPLALTRGSPKLVFVEGELNALSIYEAGVKADIVSPGSAGNFYSKATLESLDSFDKYGKILLIADKDEAGVKALLALGGKLKARGLNVVLSSPLEDANDTLVKYGKEELRKKIEQSLEM